MANDEGLKENLTDLKVRIEKIEEGVGMGGGVKERAAQFKGKAEDVKGKAMETRERMFENVQRYPLRSLGFAFWAGLTAGLLMSKMKNK